MTNWDQLKSPATEASMDAIVIVDLQGRVILFNPAAERLFGYSAEEMLGRPAEMLVAPSNRDLVKNAIDSYRKTGYSSLVGKRTHCGAVNADGREFLAEVALIYGETLGQKVFTYFVRDISAEREQRDRLERSELTYRLVAKASFDAIWDWDLVNNQIWWNDGVYKLFGYSPEEVRPDSMWWQNRIHPDDRDHVNKGIEDAFQSLEQEFWSERYRFLHQDGTYRDVLDRGYIIRGPDRKGVRFVGAMFDLSWLIEKEHDLEQSIQARDQFVGMVSHELRNPLTAIGMGLDLIERLASEKNASEKISAIVENFRPSLVRMEQVVKDLLDVSLIETRKLKINSRRADLDSLIQNAITTTEHLAKKKSILIETNLEPALWIECDPLKVEHVFTRLLENAIQSTPKGKNIHIKTRASTSHHGLDCVRVEFIDQSPGISRKQMPRVFERFWQPKESAYKGTGLGLFIAQGVIRANHGTISVECEPGYGCTFIVQLPALKARSNTKDATEAA